MAPLRRTARPALFRGGHALGFDPAAAVRALGRADPVLGRLMRRVGPFGLKVHGRHSLFESLVETVIYQQLNGKAAASIAAKLYATLPGPRPTPAVIRAATDEQMRAAGLSRSKIATLRDLGTKVETGVVPPLRRLQSLDDDAIVERLTVVRGIGRWTAEMLLIFRLGRPDVLPAHDYGIRKGFARAFGNVDLPTPAEIFARGERWRPYRTVASWYLWRAAEQPG